MDCSLPDSSVHRILLQEYWSGLWLFGCLVMSDFLRPHRWQHARPPCPSSSPRVCPSSCPLNPVASSVVEDRCQLCPSLRLVLYLRGPLYPKHMEHPRSQFQATHFLILGNPPGSFQLWGSPADRWRLSCDCISISTSSSKPRSTISAHWPHLACYLLSDPWTKTSFGIFRGLKKIKRKIISCDM